MLINYIAVLLAIAICNSNGRWNCNQTAPVVPSSIPHPCNKERSKLDKQLLPVPCSRDQDCYFHNKNDLNYGLQCYAGMCKCTLAFTTIHHVEFINGKCLISKYGPCNISNSNNNTKLSIGCLDGFHCIENQCRDPNSTTTPNTTIPSGMPYQFNKLCNDGCNFSEKLDFTCSTIEKDESQQKCQCRIRESADDSSLAWHIYNYGGASNCSVGKFGPCGEQNGLKVDCYGEGLECRNGTCTDPKKLKSNKCEPCEKNEDCTKGICNSNLCIPPNSLAGGHYCDQNDACMDGLKCKYNFYGARCERE